MARPISRSVLRRKLLCIALAACFPAVSGANPLDPSVVSGTVDFRTTGSTLRITNSPGAIINWGSFSIGAGELTHFQQQSASSQVLNRVVGGDPSRILGTLSSNGQVFLINPNGIAFGPGATVDVAGLVASTLNISNADFLAGRLSFAAQAGAGSIRNDGTLQAANGGRIFLVAPTVENHGVITAPDGSVVLAAGHSITLIDSKRPDVQVQLTADPDEAVNVGRIVAGSVGIYAATIRQGGSISATTAVAGENGTIVLRATSSVITDAGSSIAAAGAGGGSVEISADLVWHAGSITTDGGIVRIGAGSVFQSGSIRADGAFGGEITVQSTANVLQTEASILSANGIIRGGEIRVAAGAGQLFSSGRFEAMAASGTGGRITLTGDRIALVAATADTSGASGGGAIRIGGDFHGADAGAPNSQSVYASDAVSLRSDATDRGDGGTVVAWSDGTTRFAGSISVRGGANGGNGGLVEVSAAGGLRYAGNTDATAPRGATGTLLLDPKNIIIDDSAPGGSSGYIVGDFIDPNPTAGAGFGSWFNTSQLFNGNLLVRVPDASVGNVAHAGAAYLFNGTTRALIGVVTGSKAHDNVGDGTTFLNNGNYIIQSANWDGERGALTFGTPDSLVSGVVGAANSLVGSSPGDLVGSGGIGQLGGNKVWIGTPSWTNIEASAANAGAFTIVDAGTGLSGNITALNSLIGAKAGDNVGGILGGISTITPTNAGSYVLVTPTWNGSRGAATFVNPNSAPTGAIDGTNSLVGAIARDGTGMSVQMLSGNDYAVIWPNWSDQGVAGTGAITFSLSNGGVSGVVGAANSLLGNQVNSLSEASIRTLNGGSTTNYLVVNPGWSDAPTQQIANGAVTFVDRTVGIAGKVSATNSLVGGSSNQRIGDDVRIRDDGSYLVVAPDWTDEVHGLANAGAVSFGSSTTGVAGVVSASNSFVGDFAGDRIGSGGIYNVANGNFVIASPQYNAGRGVVTWVNGTTGTVGTPDVVPSLRGSTPGDNVGSGVTVLSNGNYVVHSSEWSFNPDIPISRVGAVTWVAGATGFIAGTSSAEGAVSRTNSLTGDVADARFGSGGVLELTNGNYLVLSPDWTDDPLAPEKGAVTYLYGDSGNIPQFNAGQPVDLVAGGIASSSNSLVGKFAHDRIGADLAGGLSVSQLFGGTNAGIVIRSPRWNSETGAVTWMSLDGHLPGQQGFGGVVDIDNSVVGSVTGDRVGEEFRDLFNGSYLIGSPHWSDGARDALAVGAVTLFRSGTGERIADNATAGVVSSSNSLVGANPNENIGSVQTDVRQVFLNSGTRFLLYTAQFDAEKGALTWLGDGTTAVTGVMGATNSLVGAGVGNDISTVNDTVVVSSPDWNGGRGAVTFIGSDGAIFGTGGKTFGTIAATNSIVGSSTGDNISYRGNFFANPGGTVVVVGSDTWNGNRGAISFVDAGGAAGVIGPSNSLVGAGAGDRVGSGGFTSFGASGSQQRVVFSPEWNGTRGTMTYYAVGTLDAAFAAAHGLVGTTANDRVGSSGIENVGFSSSAVLKSPNWNGNAGAVSYLGDGRTQVTGAVSAANSIIGGAANERVGNGGVLTLSQNAYVVLSSSWTDNASPNLGAITWADARTGRPLDGNGVVSRANSLIGPVANAAYGARFSSSGADIRTRFVGNTFYLFAPTVPSASAAVNGGRLMLVDVSTSAGSSLGSLSFANQAAGDVTIRGIDVASALAKANLVLEANNDITLMSGTSIAVAGTKGHDLTLRAGRSVLLNGSITTANGDLTVIANEQINTGSAPTGVVAVNRDSGRADIVMASGTTINAGSGDVRLEIHDGRRNAGVDSLFNQGGDITATDIRGANIAMLNFSRPDVEVGSVFLQPATSITTTAPNGLVSILTSNIVSVDGLVKAPNGRIELRAGSLELGQSFVDGGIAFDAKDILIAPDAPVLTSMQVGGNSSSTAGTLFVSQAVLDSLKVTGTLQLGDTGTSSVALGRLASNLPASTVRFGPGSGGAESVTGQVKITGDAGSSITIGDAVVSRVAGFTFDRPAILGGDIDAGAGALVFNQDATATGTHLIRSTAPIRAGTAGGIGGLLVNQGAIATASRSVLPTPAVNGVVFRQGLIAGTGADLSLEGPSKIEALQVIGGTVRINGSTAAASTNLSSGSIVVPGTFQVADFSQSGGIIESGSGSGNFIVTRSYNVEAGRFGHRGGDAAQSWESISITQRSGDLVLDRQMDAIKSLTFNAPAGILKVDAQMFSEGTLTLTGARGIDILQNVASERNLTISTPRDLIVSDARVTSSFGTIAVSAGALRILAGEGPAEIVATSGRVVANVIGDVNIVGSNSTNGFARIGSQNAECLMTVGGDLVLQGGGASSAFARVFGTPDVGTVASPLTVGGKIILTSGVGEGGFAGSARIEAFAPDTIHLRFPNLAAGGYTVNGKAVVSDSGSGFFAGGDVAVLNRNLLISYGQGSGPPFDPTTANVTAAERGAQFLFPRTPRRSDDEPTLPGCR